MELLGFIAPQWLIPCSKCFCLVFLFFVFFFVFFLFLLFFFVFPFIFDSVSARITLRFGSPFWGQ